MAAVPPPVRAAWPTRRPSHWTDRLVAFLQRSRITPLVLSVLVGLALFGVYRNRPSDADVGPAEIRAEAASDVDLEFDAPPAAPEPRPSSTTSLPAGAAVGALGLDPAPGGGVDITIRSAFEVDTDGGELSTSTTAESERPRRTPATVTSTTVAQTTTTTTATTTTAELLTTTTTDADTTTSAGDGDGDDDDGDDDEDATTTTTTEAVARPGPGCHLEGSIRSLGAGNLIEIFVRNNLSEPVEIHWIDYDGRRISYGSIQPGATLSRPTFEEHPWLVSDQSGSCLHLISDAPDRAVINIG